MEPIINPLYFYLIDISNEINMLLGFILIVSVVVTVIYSCCWWYENSYYDKQEKLKFFKFLTTMLKIIIPCSVLVTFIPSSDTIYKMIIADNVTPHNLEVVGSTVEDGIDYIFEKINSLTLDEVDKNE